MAASLYWAWLPPDLLDSIVDLIDDLSDFFSFALVCKPWRSTARQSRRRQQILHLIKTCRKKLPMLLIPTNDNSDVKRSLYSVTDGAVYQIQMPMPCNRRFSGSCQGWLFMVDKSMNITLINPFLNKTVVLPKFKAPGKDYRYQYNEQDNHDYFIQKAILLLPETPQKQGGEDLKVVLIYGGMNKLSYLKSRDAPWKTITLNASLQTQMFSDIISYKGQVFGVSFWSALVRVDVTTGTSEIVIEATDIEAQTTYLVESQDGNLLLVRRFLETDDNHIHVTKTITVYILSWNQAGNPHWVRHKSIGTQALFLGASYSVSVSTRDFPQCRSNSIYYVDDYLDILNIYVPRVDDDSGIYNMEDDSFSRHYVADPSFCPSLPPIWIVPKLKNINETSFNLDCVKID